MIREVYNNGGRLLTRPTTLIQVVISLNHVPYISAEDVDSQGISSGGNRGPKKIPGRLPIEAEHPPPPL